MLVSVVQSTVRYRSSKDVGDLHTPHISVRKNEYVYAQLNEGTKISEYVVVYWCFGVGVVMVLPD